MLCIQLLYSYHAGRLFIQQSPELGRKMLNHSTRKWCPELQQVTARRSMYSFVYHATYNHRRHCKPFNTNFPTLV